jgi:6-phosphogluconolactonase
VFKSRFQNAIDVALLGIGEDGHIASLFPGRSELNATETVIAISDSPKPPKDRITLTLQRLMTAHTAVILAKGPSKRRAIERVMARDPELPTSRLKQVILVTDQEL